MPTVMLRAQSDERLARLAAAGSERAFEAIVERYRRPLMGYARRMVGDSRAEDVVQAALMGAWKQLQEGAEIRDPRAWLYRVVHNGAINALKRSSASDLPLFDGAPARDLDLQDQVEHRETVRAALDEIAALPAQQRTALLAVCVQGRRHRDISRELGVSEGAVRMLIHRARSTVRTAATALIPWPLAHWLAGGGRAAELGGAGAGAGLIAGGTFKAAALIAAAGVAATAGPSAVEAVQHQSSHHARHAATALVLSAPATTRRSGVAAPRSAAPLAPPVLRLAVQRATPAVPQRRTLVADARPAPSPAPAGAPAQPATPASAPDAGATAHTATPTTFLAPASAPAPAKAAPPVVDDDYIAVQEDPPDLAAGEQAIGPDGVPDQYIPPDTPEEQADAAIANGPDDPADTSADASAAPSAGPSPNPAATDITP